jgi:amino acid transporter
MKNGVRLLISGFIVVLIALAALGFRWWGLEGPKPPPADGRPVLAVGIVAGLVGLWALWRDRGPRDAR